MSKESNTFDRDLNPIRIRTLKFPRAFNVLVPYSASQTQITRRSWLDEPEADFYTGIPFTITLPAGSRCLWTARIDGYAENIQPQGAYAFGAMLSGTVDQAERE